LQSSKQNGKSLKAVSLGTAKPPPSKPIKEIYCKPTKQSGKGIKKRSRLELQRHKVKSIAH
jgi:hypothetical protein